MLRNCNDDWLTKVLPDKVVKRIDFDWDGKVTIFWKDGSSLLFTPVEINETDVFEKRKILRKRFDIDIQYKEKEDG